MKRIDDGLSGHLYNPLRSTLKSSDRCTLPLAMQRDWQFSRESLALGVRISLEMESVRTLYPL